MGMNKISTNIILGAAPIVSVLTGFLVCCRSQDISENAAADIVAYLQTKYHSGCVSIIHSNNESENNLPPIKLHKLLCGLNIQAAVLEIQTFNVSCECRCNRPLYIMFGEVGAWILSKVMNLVEARWLIFDSGNYSIKKIDVPMDCEVYLAQQSGEEVHIIELYRVDPKIPAVFTRVASWSPEHGLQWSLISMLKRRSNFHGKVFRGSIALDCATTVPVFINNTIVRVGGYFGHIWSTLEETLNFTTLFASQPLWGTKLPNGRWTGMLGSIIRNESDVGISTASLTSRRMEVVDFLMPFMFGRVSVFISRKKVVESSSNFTEPFKSNLWIAITAAVLVLAFSLWAICCIACHYGSSETSLYSLQDALHLVFSSFCAQGHDSTPKSWSCRIVFVTSYMVGLVLLSAYSAALISFLAVQRTVLPFQTLEELLSDGTYNLGIPGGEEVSYFINSADKAMKYIYEHMIAPNVNYLPTYEEVERRVCTENNYAFVMSDYMNVALRERKQIQCNLTNLPQVSFRENLGMTISKGSPYRRIINHKLRKMVTAGIIHRFRELYWFKERKEAGEHDLEVTLEAVVPIFTFLLSGLAISVIILAVEVCVHKGQVIFQNSMKNPENNKSNKLWNDLSKKQNLLIPFGRKQPPFLTITGRRYSSTF